MTEYDWGYAQQKFWRPKLKEARAKLGLTIDEFSKVTGIDKTRIFQLENINAYSRKDVSVDEQIKIHSILELDKKLNAELKEIRKIFRRLFKENDYIQAAITLGIAGTMAFAIFTGEAKTEDLNVAAKIKIKELLQKVELKEQK